jgi:predicted nucleic acid-binding protein
MKEKNKFRCIFDTSALIGYLAAETGADEIGMHLKNSAVPFIVLTELYYLIWLKKDRAEANKIYGIIKSWNLPFLFPTELTIITAGRLKAIYRLGIADSYIAAFAFEYHCPLVTKDADFKILQDEIKLYFFS